VSTLPPISHKAKGNALFDYFRRKKVDPEIARRAILLRAGRIADGAIFDIETDANGTTVIFYSYTVNGVEYESSQYLDSGQVLHLGDYSPGATVTIRFDPHQPVNSLVV
jgi:hypothetical protein